MTIDGIETLTEVTAILSPGLRSSSARRCSARVLRYIGIELMAATPLTSILPRVRSHSVRKAGGPAEMKSADPESRASFMIRRPADIRPVDRDRDAGLGGLFLDQSVFLHEVQRQKSEATGAERHLD